MTFLALFLLGNSKDFRSSEPETGTKTKYIFLIINHTITRSNLSPVFLFKLLPPLFTVLESTSPVSLNYFYRGRRTSLPTRLRDQREQWAPNVSLRLWSKNRNRYDRIWDCCGPWGTAAGLGKRVKQKDGWTSQWSRGHKAREEVEGLRSAPEMRQDRKTKP